MEKIESISQLTGRRASFVQIGPEAKEVAGSLSGGNQSHFGDRQTLEEGSGSQSLQGHPGFHSLQGHRHSSESLSMSSASAPTWPIFDQSHLS